MKKIALVISVMLLVFGFLACKQNKPEPVVEKFYTHFYRSEFGEIQKYVMPEHRSYYELLNQYLSSTEDTARKPQIKISDIKCKITDDTIAVCSCLILAEDHDTTRSQQIIQLKKVDKEWLINQGKEGNNPFVSNESEEDRKVPDPKKESSEMLSADGEKTDIDE
ncbi:MAG: hypothetical protein LBI60_01320 [Bacteroidales bacterium]|jgi:hypothetical protein|nr:hypothetical protein [Bacteroidales bacterium]